MPLFLVQHGKSLTKEEDPEQGLSREGKTETRRVAELAKAHNLRVGRIHHSEKKRARETAEIFADLLQPQGGVHEIAGIKPLDSVVGMAEAVNPEEDLMLVGHLPFMERLVSFLITGSVSPSVLKFRNSGIVCLDKAPETNAWMIQWALTPKLE